MVFSGTKPLNIPPPKKIQPMRSSASPEAESLEDEIQALESRLAAAKLELRQHQQHVVSPQSSSPASTTAATTSTVTKHTPFTPAAHLFLLLADSALPLGSFAFSSGLESFLQHQLRAQAAAARPSPQTPGATASLFGTFLPLSLTAHASATLPFFLAAHRNPSLLAVLDDALDATITCAVARRASVSQGRALLAVWERAFARRAGGDLARALPLPLASAHLPPLQGAMSRVFAIDARDAAHAYVLSHAKTLVSAAVRASVFGPYRAQAILSSAELRDMISAVVEREWDTAWEDAGQTVPVLDLWTGRHELLYSRIFNG